MTWEYQCRSDRTRLMAEDKDQLAEKMVQHMKIMHDTEITIEQALQELDKDIQQAA